jgi:hypothetical protein
MQNLDINQLKELVLFYNKKSAELELQSLERQLMINSMDKTMSAQRAAIEELTKKINEMFINKQENMVKEEEIKQKNITNKPKTGK